MNYLLSPCFDSGNGQYGTYREMQALSLASYKKNLEGPWEFLQLDGLMSPAAMFRTLFWVEQGLVKSGANVLVTGADTLCVKPTSIFGKYDKFMMFGPADCDSIIPAPEITRFMCGLYYYPSNLDPRILKIGEDLALNWRDDMWGYCQWLYNKMYYAQPNPSLDSRFSYQLPDGRDYVDNGIPLADAHIIHFHATRDAQHVLNIMRTYDSS